MTARVKESLNLTNILIGIVLSLSAWTLKNVSDMRAELAAAHVQQTATDKSLDTLTVRVDRHDENLNRLNVQVGSLLTERRKQ